MIHYAGLMYLWDTRTYALQVKVVTWNLKRWFPAIRTPLPTGGLEKPLRAHPPPCLPIMGHYGWLAGDEEKRAIVF